MRSGVLSDSYIRKIGAPELFPLDARTHDNVYGSVNINSNKAKLGRDRRVIRPRAPYMQNHEFAKMMNPMNVKLPHEAFGNQLKAVVNSKPTPTFIGIKEEYDDSYPNYSTARGVLPEVAVYIGKMGLNPVQYFAGHNQYPPYMHPSTKRMKKLTLNSIHEKFLSTLRGHPSETDKIKKAIDVYEETLEQLMSPDKKFKEETGTQTDSGFEPPYNDPLRFLATAASAADPTAGPSGFQSGLNYYLFERSSPDRSSPMSEGTLL